MFNTVQWSGVTERRLPSTPRPACRWNPLPTSADEHRSPSGGYEQRQFQLGFRFIF